MSALDLSTGVERKSTPNKLYEKLKEGGVREFFIVQGKGGEKANLLLLRAEDLGNYDESEAFYKSAEATEVASALYHSPAFDVTDQEAKDKVKSVLEKHDVAGGSAVPWLRRISKRLNIKNPAKKGAKKTKKAGKKAGAKKTRKSKASGTSRSKSRSTSRSKSRSKSPKKTAKKKVAGEKKARQPRKAKEVNTDVTGFSLEELGLNNSAKIKSLFNKSLYEHEEPQLGNIGFGKKGAKEKRSGIWKVPKKIRRSELFGMNLPL